MVRIALAIVIATVAAPVWADVPDASLRAIGDRAVRLELDDARTFEGRVLAFDPAWVTVVATGTREVISVPREHVQRVILVELVPETPAAPEPHRLWGVHFGLPGTLVGDVDYGRWHAFASPNVLLPILTESGESNWFAGALGGGVSLPLSGRWKLDAFATVMPLHYTSFYTYLAGGLGIGFHHTAANGLSVGFALPLFGLSTRLGHSPYGYDAPFRYNDSLAYFYLAGFTALPLVTLGYRFPCR